MEINKKRLQELYEQEQSKTLAAKAYCEEVGIVYDETFRKKANAYILKSERTVEMPEDYDIENGSDTITNQYEKVASLSALKPDGSIMSVKEYCEFYKIPFEDVRTYKLVTHTGKGAYYNIASNPMEGGYMETFHKKILEDIEKIPNRPTTWFREDEVLSDDEHLFVIDPADVHIGKLAKSFETGEDYDNQIAVQRVREGVEGLLEKAKGFRIDKILFVGGNDILHIDTPKRTTTSGTDQDTDGMWYTNFLIAKELYIEILTRLIQVADVHFVFNPSNHDYTHGFFLADVIQTYFKDCKNITFDCSIAHRKYYVYHQNLIGTTHGDGGKMDNLPLTMAHESPDWSSCKHKYIYIHHFHHKISKDYMGVCVEALRSCSGADSWHHRNQYQHAPKAIEGFVHHPLHGQIARLTHLF
jgi:hypothetical protein